MKQKKRIIALFLVLVLATAILSPVAAAKGFSDTRGHWGEKAITRWVDLGLAAGYEDGTFRPDRMLTRGEFAALMCSLLGLAEQADNRFGDLPADMWYTPYVLACVKAGILGGTDAGAEPESPVTREQAAVILARALAIDGKAGKTAFKDNGDISWWAVHDVKDHNQGDHHQNKACCEVGDLLDAANAHGAADNQLAAFEKIGLILQHAKVEAFAVKPHIEVIDQRFDNLSECKRNYGQIVSAQSEYRQSDYKTCEGCHRSRYQECD